MASPKKGQIAQFMVPLVDATDFASIESGITESDFNSGATRKWYGVNHGTSAAFTSGTLSKTGRLIRSGVFQLTVNATENAYDRMMLRVSKTGCAEQVYEWENVDYDDSDIMSRLSDIGSDLRSYLVAMSDQLSDAHSDLRSYLVALSDQLSDAQSDLRSYLGGMSDTLSDVYALLSDMDSNFQSRVPKEVASKSLLSDVNSDLRSYLGGMSDTLSDVYALLSDFDSNFQSRVPKEVASKSLLSDVNSNMLSYLAGMSDTLSDVYALLSDVDSNFQSRIPKEVASKSLLSDVNSDLASKIGGITASISVSDISDIVSAIFAADYSDLGVAASTFGSLIRHISSSVSDVDSQLTQTDSVVDDIYSLLSDLNSNFGSRIPKEPASKSLLSDVNSNMLSYLAGMSNTLSAVLVDTGSTILATISQADSVVDDIYSLLSDLDSNFQSRIPKETAARSQLSDLASDVKSAVTAAGHAAAGADITGVPGVTGTYGAKLDWLFALARNKTTQTASLARAFNDAGSQIASATVSDNGTTFAREEWAG